MKDNLTEIVFILDRSGSMQLLTQETIGGFNGYIKNQKKEPGEAFLTAVLFDHEYRLLHDHVDLKCVTKLTVREYFARGTTALLDAIGRTINTVGERLSKTAEDEKPSHVIVVITTDGYENASKEFNREQVKQMIEYQRSKYGWQFIFLGANIDAVAVGATYGIFNSAQYTANDIGTRSIYNTVNDVTTQFRKDGTFNPDWDKDIK